MDPVHLENFSLKYHEGVNLLECTACHVCLDLSFKRHMKDNHGIRVPRQLAAEICSTYQLTSDYWNPPDILPALEFRPIFTGFSCSSCQFASKSKKLVLKHVSEHSPSATVMVCHLQNLSNRKKTKPFRVFPALNRNNIPAINSSELLTLATHQLDNLYDGGVAAETGVARGFFYPMMGWFVDGQNDALNQVDLNVYTRPIEDPERALYDSCVSYFCESIKKVNRRNYGLRKILAYKEKPFSSLQTEESGKEYAKVFANFTIFLRRLDANPLPDQLCYVEASNLQQIAQFFGNPAAPRFDLLVKIFFDFLRVKDIKKMDLSPYLVFIRMNCKKIDGSLMTTENVERLISKVIIFVCTNFSCFGYILDHLFVQTVGFGAFHIPG